MSEAYELNEALEQVNPADPERFAQKSILPLFEHLRAVDPVHYCQDSSYGPFWSITRYDDIQNIDKDHERFSLRRIHHKEHRKYQTTKHAKAAKGELEEKSWTSDLGAYQHFSIFRVFRSCLSLTLRP